MNAWSQLPNAVHIDRVLESLKTHPEVWDATRIAAWQEGWCAGRGAAWDAAWNAAGDAARDAAGDAARVAARVAARDAARIAARVAARDAARIAALYAAERAAARVAARGAAWFAACDAILALIAWDDSAQFLEMTGDKLEVWMRISDDSRAVLLLSAVRAFERIKELETV